MDKNCYNCIHSKEKLIIKGYSSQYKFDNIYCEKDRDYPSTYCKLNRDCPFWKSKQHLNEQQRLNTEYILKLNDKDIEEIIDALYVVIHDRCIGNEDIEVKEVIDKINSQIKR